jgi:hypothetical protein
MVERGETQSLRFTGYVRPGRPPKSHKAALVDVAEGRRPESDTIARTLEIAALWHMRHCVFGCGLLYGYLAEVLGGC